MKQLRILLLIFILITLLLLPSVSRAVCNTRVCVWEKNHQYYIRGNLGFPFYRKVKEGFQDSTKFALHGNIALGMVYKKVGVDIEGGYLSFKTRSIIPGPFNTKSALNSRTLFLNLFFYPTLLRNKVTPYIGVGVGRAFNRTKNRYVYFRNLKILIAKGLKSPGTAFQGIIGADWRLNRKFSVLADIRYIYLGEFTQQYARPTRKRFEKLSVVTFTVGLKYKF